MFLDGSKIMPIIKLSVKKLMAFSLPEPHCRAPLDMTTEMHIISLLNILFLPYRMSCYEIIHSLSMYFPH